MRSEVSVRLGDGQERRFDLEQVAPMPQEQARAWLDTQFVRLECEPLRATGKVLLADKLIAIARAAGPQMFSDEPWFADFSRAASAALAKPVVRLDLETLTVSY